MNPVINFTKTELASAIARGVRQLVFIGSGPLRETIKNSPEESLRVFAVDEEPPADLAATFVPTQFALETLPTALKKSDFDQLKASLFVWLGDAGYRTLEAAMASLAFIASLPRGSGVIFDYAVERLCMASPAHTALDALASRIATAGGNVKHLIQPEAVSAMLRGFGFQTITDLAQELPESGHLVSAAV